VGSIFLALPALEVVRNPTSLLVAHIWELPFLPSLLSFMVASFLEHTSFPSAVVPSSNQWLDSSTALISLSCLGEIPVPFYQKCSSCQQSHQIHASQICVFGPPALLPSAAVRVSLNVLDSTYISRESSVVRPLVQFLQHNSGMSLHFVVIMVD
jgi:hypothetical protein